MTTGAFNWWTSGVWLIPLGMVAILALLFGLAQYWRGQSLRVLKSLRAELRRLNAERRLLAAELSQHHPDDPEPFGARVRALEGQLARIAGQLHTAEGQHGALQSRIHRFAKQPWQALVAAPFFWFEIQRGVRRLAADLDRLYAELDQGRQLESQLAHVPWEVAETARRVQELARQTANRLQELRAKHLRGDALTAARHTDAHWQEAFDTLPEALFSATGPNDLNHLPKENIAAAHTLLLEAEPALAQLLSDTQGWEKGYHEATEAVRRVRSALGRAAQGIAALPDSLDPAPLQAQLEAMQTISQTMQATLGRLEIESLPELLREADGLFQRAAALDGELRELRRQHAALETVLGELGAGLKEISTQIATLTSHAAYPLAWNQSRAQLTYLSRQNSSLGSIQKPRLPEEVARDLAAANQLNVRRQELAQQSAQVSEQHRQLVALLTGPELADFTAWLADAQALATRTAAYDPENWPKPDGAATVAEDLRLLQASAAPLLAADAQHPLHEDQLAAQLEGVRRLAAQTAQARQRMTRLGSRLDELQSRETQAVEGINGLMGTLNQLAALTTSNPTLGRLAAQEIDRLQQAAAQVADDLAARAQGTVERKTRALETLLGRVETAGNKWLEVLNQNLTDQQMRLSQLLSDLEAVGPLQDGPIGEARRLLAAAPSVGVGRTSAKVRYGLDQIALEMKRRSDHWQFSAAARRALEDLANPVLKAYEEARQARFQAHEQVELAVSQLGGGPAWPPSATTLPSARQDLAYLEAQWDNLHSQPEQAIQRVAQLAGLGARYQALAAQAGQVLTRAGRDRARIEALEAALEDMVEQWQVQIQAYQAKPEVAAEIRKLLDDLAADRQHLKMEVRQERLGFEGALQELEQLRRRVRMAQVPLDANHVLDIHGQIITYR
jgi:DNA repair exonuclease SbcCD ATPase subunit